MASSDIDLVDSATEAEVQVQDQTGAAVAANALQENIARKGANAYYYAHAGTSGPKHVAYDEPPRLLAKAVVDSPPAVPETVIDKYAWSDGKASVSVYVDVPDASSLPEDAVSVHTDALRATLRVRTATGVLVLRLGPLSHPIDGASVKRKPSSIVVSLKKAEACTWFSLTKDGPASYDD